MANFTDVLIPEPIIFFKDIFNFARSFIFHVWLSISIFGLISNTINITVFAKIGFRDNVTLTLMFLSLSDLFYLIIRFPINVALFMRAQNPNHDWPFDPFIFSLGFYWWAYVFYDYSSFISVFLALVRCACVARPLRFKSMFTISRTVTILCVLFLLALTLRAPALSVFRLKRAVNPLTNSTYMSIRIMNNYRQIYKISDIMNKNIVSWTAYITVTTCVIVLASRLQAASRFRQSLMNTAHVGSTGNENTLQMDPTKARNNPSVKNEKASTSLSAKDLQVIQSVTLICVIFILSQLPFQIVSMIRLLYSEFSNSGKKIFGFSFANFFTGTFAHSNASVNILVHYNFNAKYRQTFSNFLLKRSVKD